VRTFTIGTIVTLNEKARPMPEHPKGWLVPGRRAKILSIASENKKRGNRWYEVELLGKRQNVVVGRAKVPSNWMDQ
jgi:hypothetical protein